MEDPTVQMNKSLKVNSRDKALLVRTPFMSALSNEALLKMLNAATISSLPARHVVFREGTPADHFYCVLGGYVRLYRLNREGREADIRVCGPGDTFAECQIFGDDTYRFNAQTAENTTFARFDIRTVRTLAEQEPDIAKAIMACLSQHLLTTMDCVANDRLHTAQQRVAEYLLKNCPVSGGPASLRLPFQKNLLAGMLGLAPEALSRAFSSLRRIGVTVRGRVVQIGDVRALRDI
ncbi:MULTISPECIES: Crp/Fnr family transcriptional regulator [Pseudorhizobium]|uniref:Crp/Fnr family transcriptional regulator n=1 Tax=Pseudorhizobium TaxID=1903858 RepID=UPI000B1555E5|nr:Crp/Fnr family transcriptional regulator [Pseudorhizobium marinum]MDY6963107.1 Crp/Fnr family transcriptional regulator [Pseudomonadota bacterium]|tara:strand:- start:1297 stop:2001 length:705 start_codon:yes stop_codon:yes gene_type:complete